MMVSIISYITNKQTIPEDIKSHMKRVHSKMSITQIEMDTFTSLFIESAKDAGIDDVTQREIEKQLRMLGDIFLESHQSKVLRISQSIDAILADIESNNDIYNGDMIDLLVQAKGLLNTNQCCFDTSR